jgi:hypothetical protein
MTSTKARQFGFHDVVDSEECSCARSAFRAQRIVP